MMQEIELNLEISSAVGNGRRSQAQGIHVERHAPPMIYVRSQGQTYFADDLRPDVERGVGVLPSGKGKFRPQVTLRTSSSCVHKSSAESKHRPQRLYARESRSLREEKFSLT